jgi:hypothetical protein
MTKGKVSEFWNQVNRKKLNHSPPLPRLRGSHCASMANDFDFFFPFAAKAATEQHIFMAAPSSNVLREGWQMSCDPIRFYACEAVGRSFAKKSSEISAFGE